MSDAIVTELKSLISQMIEEQLEHRLNGPLDARIQGAIVQAFQRPLGELVSAPRPAPTAPVPSPQTTPAMLSSTGTAAVFRTRKKSGPKPKVLTAASDRTKAVVKIVQAAGGQIGAGELFTSLKETGIGATKPQYHKAVKEAKAAGLIITSGQKRATKYHLGKVRLTDAAAN